LKASFVRAQNIAAVWNYCHPWQFWSNSFNFSAGVLKKRPDAFTLIDVNRSGDTLSGGFLLYS